MKHDNFERKKPINTPYLNRARVILLKHALTKADNDVYALRDTGVDHISIVKAHDNLYAAKNIALNALRNGYLSDSNLHRIQEHLHRALYYRYHESIWDAIDMVVGLFETMPPKPPQLQGIPYYHLTNKTRELFAVTVVNHNQPKQADEAATSVGGAK